MGASPFFLDVLVNTLLKEKRPFIELFRIHTRQITPPMIERESLTILNLLDFLLVWES